MKQMIWTKKFSVGVKKIDEQHKKLFDIINKAHDIDLEKDKEEGNKIFNELIEFVRVHFSTEEKYFEKCHYPEAEEHIAEHTEYIRKVLEFKSSYEKDTCNCEDVLNFLKKWLENHLKITDMKYVKNFHNCGLK